MVSKRKEQFIRSEIMTLSLAAALQRNKTYKKAADKLESRKEAFREDIRKELIVLSEKYKSEKVDGQTHMNNISSLSEYISKEHKPILEGGKLKIGTAQKTLNMYLKYLWCLGKIQEPPHCPIDAIILKIVGINNEPWTQIEDIKKYESLIKKIKEFVAASSESGLSLAEWELKVWSDKDE